MINFYNALPCYTEVHMVLALEIGKRHAHAHLATSEKRQIEQFHSKFGSIWHGMHL